MLDCLSGDTEQMSEYPDRVHVVINGEDVVLAARVTEFETLTHAPGTTIEFDPARPLRSGDLFTFTTSITLD